MYPFKIGFRYLRSKKTSSISVITIVAVAAVALGVACLLCVLSVTSGFQDVFRSKVLGVNAHVLVLKYGIDFTEYRDVIASAKRMDEVEGAAPFTINEMMMAAGDKLSNVLIKGIDPVAMPTVLDLPDQLVDGDLKGLRLEGRSPPSAASQTGRRQDTALERYLREHRDAWDQRMGSGSSVRPLERRDGGEGESEGESLAGSAGNEVTVQEVPEMPEVRVPSLAEASQALEALEEEDALPDDALYEDLFDDAFATPSGDASLLPGVVLGMGLARRLSVGVGDRVTIISPMAGLDVSAWSAAARTPARADFRVIAIFHAGFQEYDTRLAYLDLYEAQRFFQHGDTVTGVELRLRNLDEAADVAKRVAQQLGGSPFHTMDWERLNQNLFTALAIQKVVLTVAIGSIIVVAALGVVATLFMMVLEKKRDVAILKAMGASDESVLLIFAVQGLAIGLLGTAFGLLLGGGAIAYLSQLQFPLDPKVYLIDHLPVRVSGAEFMVTSVVAILICMGATLVPSWFAARLLPADGVRYE